MPVTELCQLVTTPRLLEIPFIDTGGIGDMLLLVSLTMLVDEKFGMTLAKLG